MSLEHSEAHHFRVFWEPERSGPQEFAQGGVAVLVQDVRDSSVQEDERVADFSEDDVVHLGRRPVVRGQGVVVGGRRVCEVRVQFGDCLFRRLRNRFFPHQAF